MDALVVQSPPAARELFLLFHGAGASPHDLLPLAQRIAQALPDAVVVSVPAPDRSDFGSGLQWFSVSGVTEAIRPERVAATLDRFVATVQGWQQRTGVPPASTTLLGFSQGAIMALSSTLVAQPPAARVVSLAGRFVGLPDHAPVGVRLHFVHGDADPVIPVQHAQQAAQRLLALGADVTLDVIPGLPHGIDARVIDVLLSRLKNEGEAR